ncbi:MAG: symmetrical bis(5'-nucleosyl)-tetraphosphatase [Burkholderiales bacterium]|nr:symmetrical bis(5'-nucleosyl)-tetraphosphatase [Burkholderiales bacterium]
MALYLIGDVQGCDDALERLLQHIDFSPSRDKLYMLGDMVNRGPQNLQVLRRLMEFGSSAQCVLGNHDLHLLAVSLGARKSNDSDTIQDVLNAPERDALLHWLRHQHMALHIGNVLLVHAGVLPQWTAEKTMALAGEVESLLRSDALGDFIAHMYGGMPNQWDDALTGHDRIRIIVNAFTRMRYCNAQGAMDFSYKKSPENAPVGQIPWFDLPNRLTQQTVVAFGHWSTLQLAPRADVVCLDDGCLWGGCLSALRLEDANLRDARLAQRLKIQCSPALDPLK